MNIVGDFSNHGDSRLRRGRWEVPAWTISNGITINIKTMSIIGSSVPAVLIDWRGMNSTTCLSLGELSLGWYPCERACLQLHRQGTYQVKAWILEISHVDDKCSVRPWWPEACRLSHIPSVSTAEIVLATSHNVIWSHQLDWLTSDWR